jgi:hypothetical protein
MMKRASKGVRKTALSHADGADDISISSLLRA